MHKIRLLFFLVGLSIFFLPKPVFATVHLKNLLQKIQATDRSCKDHLTFILQNIWPLEELKIKNYKAFFAATKQKTPAQQNQAINNLKWIKRIFEDPRTIILTDYPEERLEQLTRRLTLIVESWNSHMIYDLAYFPDFDWSKDDDIQALPMREAVIRPPVRTNPFWDWFRHIFNCHRRYETL